MDIRDGEPMTATSAFIQLLRSILLAKKVILNKVNMVLNVHRNCTAY